VSFDDPRPIGDSLAFVTRDLGMARPKDAALLVAHWPELVGAALAEHTRPAHLRTGTLTIEVDDGAWGAPLKYLGDELARRANEILGAALVTDLRVIVRAGSGSGTEAPSRPNFRPVPRSD